jgi:quercetin dioxygenase-like cupin family protein
MTPTTHSFALLRATARPLGAVTILAGTVAAHEAAPHHTLVPADAVTWGEAPASLPAGAQAAALLGSPGQEGPFVIRLKFPAGFVIPPHRHSKDELVTVISGRVAITSGEKVDIPALEPVPAGSFIHLPAGMPHYLWAADETIVQINGVGPFDVVYLDPADDPRDHVEPVPAEGAAVSRTRSDVSARDDRSPR